MRGIRVENMRNSNGNAVANQFIIYIPEIGKVFQSYSTVIAIRNPDGKVTLDRDSWDYSATTGRYRNQFLMEGIAETRKKIESGEYKLKDLN